MLLKKVGFEKYVGVVDSGVTVERLSRDFKEDGRFIRKGCWVLVWEGCVVASDYYFNDLSERNNFEIVGSD